MKTVAPPILTCRMLISLVVGKCQAKKRPACELQRAGNYAFTPTKNGPGLRKGVAVQPIRVTGVVRVHVAMYRSTAHRQAGGPDYQSFTGALRSLLCEHRGCG